MEVTMEENLEIEFKILLDKKIYDQIINDYSIDTSYTQTNYYLMHPILSKLKYSLRIREKNNQYELTLKQPQTTGALETNLIINKDAKDKILNNKLVHNKVFDLLTEYNLDSTMFNTNHSLKTLRKEIHTPHGLICLDYNCYNNLEDYELEYEVIDYKQGKKAFLNFIEQYNLSYEHNCISKINRLINSLSK